MTQDKTVLITGASSGFGKATAQLLAKEGFQLILVARRLEKLQELKDTLQINTHIASFDIREKNAVKVFFENLPKQFHNIDILVNNAGLAKGLDTVDTADLENWDTMVDTNIKGLLYMTRHTLENMKQRNQGLIINIGSIAATIPYKGSNVYGATKAFVRQFSKNMRTDLFGTDIKITTIEPGMAETEFSTVRFNGDSEKAHAVYQGARALTPENIAHTILWVINQPTNVNIDTIEIMPIDQTFGGIAIHRKE